MSAHVDITDAKRRIDEFFARVRAGEEIVLADAGTPVARITPIAHRNGKRLFGEFAGKIRMSADFAAPLNDDELAEWEK